MLDALRAVSQNWIGRIFFAIILGVIILSFGIWGVGDVFRNFGVNQLARVGGTDISIEAYRDAYQRALQNLEQRMQRAITAEQARQFGLDRQVLARLLSDALLDQEAKSLGLAMSDKDLAQIIVNDDKFKGPDGKFDRMAFDAQLRNAGVTERQFTKELRSDYLRQEITFPVVHGLGVPNAMLEAMNRYINESRSIDYFVLPASAAGDIPAPSEDALKSFYETRREVYRTPEYRKIVVLSLTPASLAKNEDISDAEVEKRYDEIKNSRFTEPEQRKIEQIVLPDEATATAIANEIAGGKSFEQVAAERKLTSADIDLGTVTKDKLIEKAVADAAFDLPQGTVSKPVKTQFGWALLRVTNIIPARVKPLADVKDEIRKELAVAKARKQMSKIRDEVEDRRAAGKTLAEAAAGTGLTPVTIDAVDANGNDKDGKPVNDLPDRQALLKAVFASDVGVDNEPVDTRDGGTVWFEVAGIDPARQQSLDEVKPLVEQAWKDEERRHRLTTKAADIVKKLQGREKLEAIAAAEGNLEIKHDAGVKRSGATGLSQNAVVAVFNVAVGEPGSADDGNDGRIIFRVLDASVPPLDSKNAEFSKIADQVKDGIENDVIGQFLGDLQNRVGVSVNQRALQTALGSAGDSR